jgi:hypothetical protein
MSEVSLMAAIASPLTPSEIEELLQAMEIILKVTAATEMVVGKLATGNNGFGNKQSN